jgi:hypothetical protein
MPHFSPNYLYLLLSKSVTAEDGLAEIKVTDYE